MVIKRQASREHKIVSLGESLAHVASMKTALEAQEKVIREELFGLMNVGDSFPIEDAGIYYKLEKYNAEITVLKPIDEIFKMTNLGAFLKIVSVTMTKIKEVVGKDHAMLVERYDKEPKVRLMKDKEKNKG